jgi:hypothetical protein
MISKLMTRILGVNWQTTSAGVLALIAVAGKLLLAYRTKDVEAILSNGQEMFLDLNLIAIGIGLIKAKDNNTVGAGTTAVKLHDDGTQQS